MYQALFFPFRAKEAKKPKKKINKKKITPDLRLLGTKIDCDGLAVLVEVEKMAENFRSLAKKEIALDFA